MQVGMTITGLADVNRILGEVGPREAINLIRATAQDIASQLAKSAKEKVPVESGKIKASIKAKRRRGERNRVQSDVVAGGGDAFYWRFLEYGQGPDGVEYAFFLQALQEMRPNIERVYVEAFARKLIARLTREAKRRG